jgi:hypothetical protein
MYNLGLLRAVPIEISLCVSLKKNKKKAMYNLGLLLAVPICIVLSGMVYPDAEYVFSL